MSDPSDATEPSDEQGDGRGDLTSVAAPSPLRLAGFVGTVVGALLLGLGATMTWANVKTVPTAGVAPDTKDVLTSAFKGLDLTEGKVAIVAALVLLIGLMALRGARSRKAEKVISIVMICAGVAGTVFPAALLFTADHRLSVAAGDDVKLAFGIFLCMVGGVIAVLGGILDLAWAVAPSAPRASPDPHISP